MNFLDFAKCYNYLNVIYFRLELENFFQLLFVLDHQDVCAAIFGDVLASLWGPNSQHFISFAE